jgi:hypothetical protein
MIAPKTPETRPAPWPIVDHVIAPLAEWWRRRAAVRENLDDLDAFGAAEFARMAHDVGLAASDLRSLAAHCTDAASLLERRVTALGMNSGDLAKTSTAQLRDMERLCTLCGSKGRCARDLGAHPSDPVWKEYCPNEATLTELAGKEPA